MFKRWFAVAILLGLANAPLWSDSHHPAAAVRAFNAGVEAFNANRCNEAIPHFDEALSADPDFADAYYARGACRYRLQATDGALMDLNDTIRLDSELLDARAMRGVIFYDRDQWDPALEDFNYVLERKPTDAQSLVGRGVIYLRREQKKEAESDFRHFLRAHPKDPLAPKLREMVARLSGGGAPSEDGPEASSAEAPRRKAVRQSAPPVDMKALADSLFSRHAVADKYGKSVLRGEGGTVTGTLNNGSSSAAGDVPASGSR